LVPGTAAVVGVLVPAGPPAPTNAATGEAGLAGAPASIKVVPPAPVAEPHPNSKEGKALKAARLAVDLAADKS